VWPWIGFTIWHLAPQVILPSRRGRVRFLVGVKELEPNHRILWWDSHGEFTWEWILDTIDRQTTRLLTRVQESYPPLWSLRMLYGIVASSGDIVMARKQLRGIKARAERLARSIRAPGPVHPQP
jgi:hypothetical protein